MSVAVGRSPKVLVVEDDAAMRELLEESLSDEGYDVLTAAGGRTGIRRVRENPVDLVISDIRMPDLDGLDMVRELSTLTQRPDVIMITAFGTIDTAIKAIKLGALDYITKPFEIDQLLLAVERALKDRALRHELKRLRQEVEERYGFANIIGKSAPMREVFELIRRVKDSPVSVLIRGDSGTGKELVARALHYNSSRSNMPFVPVNCAAIPDNLLESELFGYKRGAFTDANQDRVGLMVEASGGTLFLDEIGELTPSLQAKLLRALQEREVKPLGSNQAVPVDLRVVSATNKNLESMLSSEAFRKDLYYRLNVVSIDLPRLAERTDDILAIATHFLGQAAEWANKELHGIAPAAARLLIDYDWPGNVRELENVIERAVALCQGTRIEVADLPDALSHSKPEQVLQAAAQQQMKLADVERAYILEVLAEEHGNKSRAAQRLGLDRKTLYRKLEEYRRAGHVNGDRG